MENNFGGMAISEVLYDELRKIIPKGKTILELGSGSGTTELLKKWNVISIEHNEYWFKKEYIGRYAHTFIPAPINPNIKIERGEHWYNVQAIKKGLQGLKYDLILVDGPTGIIGRYGFLHYLHLFNTRVPIIIDDVHSKVHLEMFARLYKKLDRPVRIIGNKPKIGKFGIIYMDHGVSL